MRTRGPLLVGAVALVSLVFFVSLGAGVAGAQTAGLTPVAGTIITVPMGGGAGTAGPLTVTAPACVFPEGGTINYQQQPAQSAAGFDAVGAFFSLSSSTQPKCALTLQVNFTKTQCGDPMAVRMHRWNAAASKWEPVATTVAAAAGGAAGQYTATTATDTLGLFSLLGPSCTVAPTLLPKTGAPIPVAAVLLGGLGLLGGGLALRRR